MIRYIGCGLNGKKVKAVVSPYFCNIENNYNSQRRYKLNI